MFISVPSRQRRGFGRLPRRSLGSLGASGSQILSLSAGPAGIATGIGVSSLAAGTALGAWAGPIGAGVGALIGIIAGLWAGHEARAAGAKSENTALNSAVATWDSVMKAIFAAANSTDPTQSISASQAQQQVQQAFSMFWQQMCPYTKGPGRSDTSNCGQNCGSGQINPAGPCQGTLGGHKCDKACTATCCVGCQALYPSYLQAMQVFSNPNGGTVQVCTAYGSSYGFQQRSGYTLTYTPPSPSSVAGAANSLASGSVAGIPLWMILLAGGVGIYALSRR